PATAPTETYPLSLHDALPICDLDAHRRDVGIIFQSFNLVDSLTAAENVAIPLGGAGVARRAARERAETLLDSVGLGDCADRRPGDRKSTRLNSSHVEISYAVF